MSLEFDYFISYRSPYSYLSGPRIRDLARFYDLQINTRVVLPLAVRVDDFFKKANPLWPGYVVRDVARVAEFRGMSIRWPRPDPIVQDMATREVAKDQPHIYRLSRLGAAAALRGRGVEFYCEASRIIWDGQTENWHEGDHLALAAERAGLDFAELSAQVESNPTELDAVIETHQKALEAGGHWGVPTMVFEGEPFFGQDRIDLLIWRMKQRGLKRRRQTL